jgi:hypothetical protein
MSNTLDTTVTLGTLSRVNATALHRRLALNHILRESRNASSLEALRSLIEQTMGELDTAERDLIAQG